ncbi:esterase B1-like isoform X2 [Sitodiplosis mosellana]|nr:esterase B1-like isoform X2 [Sitodiplosis mosellana]
MLVAHCDPLIVKTSHGILKGVVQYTFYKNKTYYAYKGIPYAQPPVGELRFREPVPMKPWPGIRTLSEKYGNPCYAFNLRPSSLAMSEDCLFLNIFTPALGKKKKSAKLAVMLFIHGGGFYQYDGSDFLFGPDFLIKQKVILVTINYRLGPLGFFNFEERGYNGNMGFKDQLLALTWVKKNIRNFGGDPNLITVFGESAGGVSAHLLVLNPKARSNIKRAILMSGNAFSSFAFVKGNNQLDMMRRIYQNELGNNTSGAKMLQFFKNSSIDLLVKKTPFLPPTYSITSYWAAVVEDVKKAIKPFLWQGPRKTYKKDKIHVELMCGDTSAEYLVFLTNVFGWVNPLNTHFDVGLDIFPGLDIPTNSTAYEIQQNKIRNFYFGSGAISRTIESFTQYVQMMSHLILVHSSYETMMLHRHHAKTICYETDLNTTLNVIKLVLGFGPFEGMGHAEDIPYCFLSNVFRSVLNSIYTPPRNEQVIKILNFLPKVYADFAKTGSVGRFKPVTRKYNQCIGIKNDGLESIEGPRTPQNEFWSQIRKSVQPWIKKGF